MTANKLNQTMIVSHIQRSIDTKVQLLGNPQFLATLEQAAMLCHRSLASGRKLVLAGNGGSAADAQHIAAELVGRYKKERRGLPAIAITTDTSALTAIANDYGYEHVFARQVEALCHPGDVFIGITTSGNSKNILSALNTAKEIGCHTLGFTGQGGAISKMADLCVCVPAAETATVQESHIMIGHILCELIENQATLP